MSTCDLPVSADRVRDRKHGFAYLALRFWIGIWTAGILFTFVVVDASSFVCYITRFTEENFATLISVIFIYAAIEKVLAIGAAFPPQRGDQPLDHTCSCSDAIGVRLLTTTSRNASLYRSCVSAGGSLVGPGCNVVDPVPDVFLFSVILFLSTFIISVYLKGFKTASFFPAGVRSVISDFAVVIAILSMTVFDAWMNINTPKLIVPQEFKVSTRFLLSFPTSRPPILLTADVKGQKLVFRSPARTESLVAAPLRSHARPAGHHPHLYGPADHSGHRE